VTLLQGERYGWAMALIGSHLIGSLAMTLLGIYAVRTLTA
jgi:fluoride ion exporter CrcB/FEX